MKDAPLETPYFESCVGCIEGDHDECTGMWTDADTGHERDCMCRHDTHDPAAESGSADAGPSPASQGRSGRPGHECRDGFCCGCGDRYACCSAHQVGDAWGLSGPGEDHGFCSKACMALYVKGRFFLSPSQLSGVRS